MDFDTLLRCPPCIPLSESRIMQTRHCSFIMGCFNVTSDSFWSGSRVSAVREAVSLALQMQHDGADCVDIGAESTRPGAAYVSAQKEIDQLVPVIHAIREQSDIPISIDTRKCAVIEKCCAAGADILNDVSALHDDSEMADFVRDADIPVILMHKKGTPEMMQHNPVYADPVAEVEHYLLEAADNARRKGIKAEKILLDPGIGFGKTTAHNRALLCAIRSLSAHGYPVLAALSRKQFIGDVTGRSVEDRLTGTIVADLFAILCGAAMIRVHDVRQARDSIIMMEYLTGFAD